MRQAQKLGAVDQTIFNLPEAVRQADAVVLCLPLDELRKTMETIRQDLKPGVVVLDMSAAPLLSSTWAVELFPEQNCYFLSFTPAVNPAYLAEGAEGEAAAHADWFHNANIYIAHPQGIDGSAIEFSDNFARLLGGTPIFSEVHEVEGLLALSRWLPVLSAAAVQAAAREPGWIEARRLAGPDFAFAGLALGAFPHDADAGLGLLGAKENTLRMIDLMTGELAELRSLIAEEKKDELSARLGQARSARATWLRQRRQSKWEDESEKRPPLPTFGDTLGRLVGLKPRNDRTERKDHAERKQR
jgi:prephenate dehydrogenase